MATVRSHLHEFHKAALAVNKEHAKKARKADDEPRALYHDDMAGLHAECMAECDKSVDSEGLDLNKIIPDNIRGVIPNNPTRPGVTAVPRVGQPTDLVNKANTPTEFAHLLTIE